MQCILCKIYFWKVFHKYYNFIYTPICTKFLFLQKVGVTHGEPVVPSLGCLLQPIQRLAEKIDAHMLCRINKSSKLALVDSL
jgi:hypothetical protein